MQTILIVFLVIAAGATLFVLIRGVVGMAQQTDPSGRRSQDLMRKRVMFQAAAVLIAVLLMLSAGD